MTSYLRSIDYAKCYGCRACEHICPKNAIIMSENDEGFLYPSLNEEKCIKCGLCSNVCPYDSSLAKNTPLKAFAAQHKDGEILLSSSSGGVFSALANYVLSQNGYVSGCIFDNNFNAVHILTNQEETVSKMRGSKYVQSDLKDIYIQIENLLIKGIFVLFTGTPCQVDGLRGYLKKEYDNLLTVDLICHGVPSPKLLQTYLESLKEKKGIVSDLKFRDKTRHGWRSQGTITINNKKKTISPFNNSYYQLYYLKNCVSRMSCYSCKYASTYRVGDISIGDYWNISDDFPKLDVSSGFSAVLINTKKGESSFKRISEKLTFYETSMDNIARGNKNLRCCSTMPESRNFFYSRLTKEGYDSITKKDCKYQFVIPFIKRHIPKRIKRFLKKVLK